MKLCKSLLILTSMITLGSSLFAKELTRNDYIKFYQEAEIPNESLDNLEKFKVKEGDSLETCIKKIYSSLKAFNLARKRGNKKLVSNLFKLIRLNGTNASKLYPNNLFLKLPQRRTKIKTFKYLVTLMQESANNPYLNMEIYGPIFVLDKVIQNDKALKESKKRYEKLCATLFEYQNEADLKEQLDLLKKYWRNLLDDDFIVKTNAGPVYLKDKRVELTDEELTKARKIWAKLVENVMKYDDKKKAKAKCCDTKIDKEISLKEKKSTTDKK